MTSLHPHDLFLYILGDGVLEELMLGSHGKELEYELVRVGEEVVVLVYLSRLSGSLKKEVRFIKKRDCRGPDMMYIQ
jgi:hypothetical protein